MPHRQTIKLSNGTTYKYGKYSVTVGTDGSIRVKAGDWLSKYSAAIYGNFWTLDIFPRFTLPLVIGPLFLVARAARRQFRALGFYTLATGLMVLLAWAGWANRGAGFNVYELEGSTAAVEHAGTCAQDLSEKTVE